MKMMKSGDIRVWGSTQITPLYPLWGSTGVVLVVHGVV